MGDQRKDTSALPPGKRPSLDAIGYRLTNNADFSDAGWVCSMHDGSGEYREKSGAGRREEY